MEGLTLRLPGGAGVLLEGVTFRVDPGERVGIVGPSGAGKTLLLLSILGLPPRGARTEGRVLWGDEDLLDAPAPRLRSLRGREMAMVFQAPAAALHPLQRVDRQVAEAMSAHARGSIRAHAGRARGLLREVGLAPTGDGHWPFPHELSGGQRQRVVVAMAVANRPALLLADEPTTALDVVVQARVLDLLEARRRDVGAALLLVSHDADVVRRAVDRVLVLEGGRLVGDGAGRGRRRAASAAPSRVARSGPPALEVEGMSVVYRRPRLLGGDVVHRAVVDVSLAVEPGETLAVVGASGAGKSTLARAILGLQPGATGRVAVAGRTREGARGRELRAARRGLQIVFQDPTTSLHPLWPVGRQVGRPLRTLAGVSRRDEPGRVAALLEAVALPPSHAGRLPHELSAGEQQRVCIARALAPDPDVIVLDEPVSGLDADTREEILALLAALQAERGAAYLLISHDLGLVRGMAHRVAVMAGGRIVETGEVEPVLAAPVHPATVELATAAGLGGAPD